jgi:hypothetical protein
VKFFLYTYRHDCCELFIFAIYNHKTIGIVFMREKNLSYLVVIIMNISLLHCHHLFLDLIPSGRII